jgi:hypothetical protein
MTDRDVEHGSHRDEKAAGPHTPTGTPQRPGSTRPMARTGKRADPTEPEVPSAKRVRAIRKQRSLLLIGAAIMALLSIVLFLLYKTGRQVTTLPGAPAVASAPLGAPARANFEAPNANETPQRAEPAPAASPSVTPASSSGVPTSAPRTKASAPSTDIFRKPAF